jgi:sulfite reductase alpha subunit-like flavoprotein
MPIAVREALVTVMESEGALCREDAEARLAQMEKEGRYQQETW